MKKEYDIFISYRREGGKEYARNLTSELVSRGFHPFLDFDELKDGKFDKRITDAIESAPVFMFILSPGALDRCVNEDDWVRKEILHAVEHKRHIVPVDIDKQFETFPSAADFPPEIKNALGQHQFSQIQTETLYKVSIDEMVKNRIQPAIDEYMREKQKAAGMAGAEIHIETDMDCHVQRFHRDMIIAKVDEENVIHLPKGKHKLQFIAVGNPDVKDSCEYKVEDVTESDFIEVFLQEKAGIVSVEAEELESLRKEKDTLTAMVQSLQQQLEAAIADAQQLSEQSKAAEGKLRNRIDEISLQLTATNTALADKERKIASLEKSLSDTEVTLSNVRNELQSYKDAEARRKAEEEAKRKAELARKKAEAEAKAKAEAALRKKAEEEKKRSIIKVGNVEFKMIYVVGGTFWMGEGSNAHQVTLSSYYIGETPVTQALWKELTGKTPSCFKGESRPVVCVSWNDCQEFIKKLNAKTGKKFRLLTEAEWEYAARGGNKSKGYEYAGSNDIEEVAWYWKNSGDRYITESEWDYNKVKKNNCQIHPVKQKKPNELGIYDMSGNVWEWCQDWYGNYKKGSQINPTGPTSGSDRVNRGGSWLSDVGNCRLSYRDSDSPGIANDYLGLRLALSE